MNDSFKRIGIIALMLLSATLAAYAQPVHAPSDIARDSDRPVENHVVKGKILDWNGEPVVGAGVSLKNNTGVGTVTDIDGLFSISVPRNSVLSVSCIGCKTAEISVGDKDYVEAVLQEDATALDELVVVGYGTMRKKDLTGAMASVSGNVLAERKQMSLSSSLQGAMPGIMVTRSNGAPGSEASIRIRGITTIGDSSPLVIVDGVPVDNIDYVNPDDVESISVLKDAASASIYGARAASGVILITTHRAREGKFGVAYSFEYGIERMTGHPDYVSPTRYMEITNELRWNDAGNGSNKYPVYSKDLIENYYSLNAEDPDAYPITDWYDLVTDDNASRQTHRLRISGGTGKLKTNISLGFDKSDGLYVNKNVTRYTARVNNDFNINKYISAVANIDFRHNISGDAIKNPFQGAVNDIPSIYAGLWKDGRYGAGREGSNIYAIINEGGSIKGTHSHIGGNIGINVKPIDGFTLSAYFAPTFNKGKTFKKAIKYYDAKDPTLLLGYMSGYDVTKLSESRNDSYKLMFQALANYVKSIGRHNFSVMAGYESNKSFNENLGASRDNYLLDSFPYLDLGPLEFRDNSGSAYEYAYRSWFGRATYNFDNRYLLQVNVRTDGSSRFHKDHRWGTFPSISGGWVISREPFFKQNDILSFLKLRLSWGRLGNERIGNYPYQSTIRFTNIPFMSNGGEVEALQAATPSRFPVKDITWENTESWNVGIDSYLIDSRLKFTFDYFRKKTNGMLLALEIPDYVGYETNPDMNTGKMYTSGYEIELGWKDEIGDFSYYVSGNLSDFKSKMGDLGGTEFIGDQIKKEGSEFNEWYGYVSDGLFQTQEELDNSPVLNKSVKVGDIKYRDISGPDGVPDGKISPEYDRVLLGGSLPRYMFGLNLGAQWKGLDFSMTFQGVGKRNVRLTSDMVQPLRDNWANVPRIIDGYYWSHYNTAEQNLAAKYPRLTNAGAASNYVMSDFWLFNGAYLRMKNITLGYTIPSRLTRKIAVDGVRIYAAVNDLFQISRYPKGWDPELTGFAYPITTSYVFGISVNL